MTSPSNAPGRQRAPNPGKNIVSTRPRGMAEQDARDQMSYLGFLPNSC
ncbi:hypothetical protein [Actinocorallia longicatena]